MDIEIKNLDMRELFDDLLDAVYSYWEGLSDFDEITDKSRKEMFLKISDFFKTFAENGFDFDGALETIK